jgi:hypothetical protein
MTTIPPIPSQPWTSSPLLEAIESGASTVIVDTDCVVDCGPVINFHDNGIRTIKRASGTEVITVATSLSPLLTVSDSHLVIELEMEGGNNGIDFADPTGGCCFDCRIGGNYRPTGRFTLTIDDAGAVGSLDSSGLLVAGHTASEIFIESIEVPTTYAQKEIWVQGGQSVDIFIRNLRQDVGVQA